MDDLIRIRGAAEHNLRSVDLDLPRGRLTAVTGVSGSGKSSLVFDTLFAEGRRRYMECLSLPGRPLASVLAKPAVGSITGLTPTLAISGTAARSGPRSTVGTMTEIYDLLRVLFARAGEPRCHRCDGPVEAWTSQEIVAALASSPEGTRIEIFAPLVEAGPAAEALERARREGFVRVRVDGEIRDVGEAIELEGDHTVELVVDRIVVKERTRPRLAESVELALSYGDGRLSVREGGAQERFFSERRICPVCRIVFPDPHPRYFSFNAPEGMCPTCQGLGAVEGRICPDCGGGRLRPESRAVRLGGATLPEVAGRTIVEALGFFESIELPGTAGAIARTGIAEIVGRLAFLVEVGLEYLTLDRAADALSGGESNRVRLADQLGSRLSGVTYCLDEPSVGLHPRDVGRLMETLGRLRDAGNTVVVVEHDREAILTADRVVEFGPGAGREGGRVVFEGTAAEILEAPGSPTGAFLSGRRRVERSGPPRGASRRRLVLFGARAHNLNDVDVAFPLERLVGVCGVSGAGKSSLVLDTLRPALAGAGKGETWDSLQGADRIARVVEVEQAPLGRSSRSNPATYVKAFDEIRRFYAELKESKIRGYGAARFSFNVHGGRCEACQGEGVRRIEMHFLPDVLVACDVCGGRRFNEATLAVRYRGLSIADLLDLTIEEALRLFDRIERITSRLEVLAATGLGYLTLGQPSSTLSAGEAQRVRLARELQRPSQEATIYLLDEPSQGLHLEDVQKLLAVLDRLVEAGHSVVLIDHDLDLLAACDHLIELGPGGGASGGRLIAQGTPGELAMGDSPTGRALRGANLPHRSSP